MRMLVAMIAIPSLVSGWLALTSPVADATDAIRLRCSGAVYNYKQNVRGVVNAEALNIDIDQMLMTGLMGTYPVTPINYEAITVDLWTTRDDGYKGHIFINVDRLTGKAHLIETSDAAPNKMLIFFDLICRNARQF